jgi:hypothetical protein
MSKRARWDGVEPIPVYPPGDVEAFHRRETLDVVEPGKYLSGDVPQRIHEELAAGDPRWTLVEYNPPGSKSGDSAEKESN